MGREAEKSREMKARSVFLFLKRCEGMITVEVSVIIPIFFFLTGGLLFFQLFMIDMAAVKSTAMQAAEEAAVSWKIGSNREIGKTGTYQIEDLLERNQNYLRNSQADQKSRKMAETLVREKISGRCLLVKRVSSSAAIQRGRVHTGIRILFPLPMRGISRYMGTRGWTFSCSQTAIADDWQEGLRRECAKECADRRHLP